MGDVIGVQQQLDAAYIAASVRNRVPVSVLRDRLGVTTDELLDLLNLWKRIEGERDGVRMDKAQRRRGSLGLAPGRSARVRSKRTS